MGEIPVVQSICDGGDAGKPVALNADSITGTAFRQLADEVVKAVEENTTRQKSESHQTIGQHV